MPLSCVQLDDEMFEQSVVPTWERSFGIRFARSDFARATTVGDIWAVVERHLVACIGENPTGLTLACATQRTFYRLRRALMAQGWARAEVVPCTPLHTLLPWRQRRQGWGELQRLSELPLPGLQMSVPFFGAFWAGCTVVCWGLIGAWDKALILGLAVPTITSQLPWALWVLPSRTLGELTARVVATHYRTLSHPYVRHNLGEMRDVVLAGLARCGAESAEIDPDELYDGTRLEW